MNKEHMKSTISSDLYRYRGSVSSNILKDLITNSGFRYMYLFRKCQYFKNRNNLFYVFYRIILGRHTLKYGYEIPVKVQIGKGFYINHLGGIAINQNAIIGDNVNITKGVTIGQTNRGKKKGVPVIGNRVWIGANATIVGNIKIGNNVLIAPNSYVNIDVPDNTIVVGNPAKLISELNAVEGYINNIV